MIAAIVAVDANFGIGYDNQLLESIPEDLARFKELTTGHTVIMGRKTYDSLPKKPLPNRLNIIVTSEKQEDSEFIKYMSLQEAQEYAAINKVEDDIFIIGGASIYEVFLPMCDEIYLTQISESHENVDTYFPIIEEGKGWACIDCSDLKTYEDVSYQFKQYRRI